MRVKGSEKLTGQPNHSRTAKQTTPSDLGAHKIARKWKLLVEFI
jgi:hypothetical protein